MIGEYGEWATQITHSLAQPERRLAQAEARLERLDAHSGELAREVLDVIARVDALDESLVRHQGQNEDDLRRAGEAVDRVGADLSRHEDTHWRSGR